MEANNEGAPTTLGNDKHYRNVLIVRFSALGDVAMTVPVIYSACICYPDVRFVFLTRPSMVGLFINAPKNLLVVGADLKNEYKGPLSMRRLAKNIIKKYQIEALIDLHDVIRTKILRYFCKLHGIHVVSINKGRSHKRALTRRHNKVMLPLVSSRDRYREAFFNAGFPVEPHFNGLYGKGGKGDPMLFMHILNPSDTFSRYGTIKPKGTKWVGIAPFAAHEGKIYPLEKMEEVISMLEQRSDVKMFIFGAGEEEEEVAEEWVKKYRNVTSLVGKKYGFTSEMALLSHLDTMLTMDSANMHLAAIAGIRTVSIWGATHHYCGFRGWHQRENDMVQVPLSCRPCSVFGDKKCFRHDLMCMNAIRPDMVYNKICEIIDPS